MIKRYTRKPMGDIWTEENKYQTWLKVEIAACQAMAEAGKIPQSALDVIRARANFSVDRIEAIEAETRHDVIAFLTSVAEFVGPDSRYIHLGLTSSDVLDTSMACLLKHAGEMILEARSSMNPSSRAKRWRAAKTWAATTAFRPIRVI